MFAQDQVTALPPPSTPAALEAPIAPITGESHEHLIARLQDLADEIAYTVSIEALERGDGYWGSC